MKDQDRDERRSEIIRKSGAPGCDDVTIQIASVDGEVIYDQHPRAYTSFVNDVPSGEYTIAVTSDCDEWTIDLNEF